MAVTDNDMLNNQSFPGSQSKRLEVLIVLEELRSLKDRAERLRSNAGTDTAYQYWGGYRMGVDEAIHIVKSKMQ